MIKLHLGCGRRHWPDWISIDGGYFPHLYSHDITKLPFDDNEVSEIYSSHTLEYFDRSEVISVLKEWNRVLKQGGILRVAVPDFTAMCDLYTRKSMNLKYFLGPLYGKMQMGDKTIYHKTVYDFDNLEEVLVAAGFKDVDLYDWRKTGMFENGEDDQSRAYLPDRQFETGKLISLNVECTK